MLSVPTGCHFLWLFLFSCCPHSNEDSILLLLPCIPKHNPFISPALPVPVLYGVVLLLPDLGPYSIEELISVNLVCVPSPVLPATGHPAQHPHM